MGGLLTLCFIERAEKIISITGTFGVSTEVIFLLEGKNGTTISNFDKKKDNEIYIS
ncbi:MAG: hypothetical protein WCW35_09670 [Bacteroidota bacterium]|jgi:hypothetical protein